MKKNRFNPFADEIIKFTFPKKSFKNSIQSRFKKSKIKFDIDTISFRASAPKLVLLCVLLVFISRAGYLQLTNRAKYQLLSQSNKTRNTSILAERGVIYDKNGQVLARNKPSFAVELNLTLCDKICPQIISKINDIVPVDKTALNEELKSGKKYIIIGGNLDKDQVLAIETNLYQLPGVSVIVYPIRDYMYSEVFAHSIGYVGLDDKSLEPNIVGKTAVEESYNQYLSGIPGRKVSEVDSTGKKYDMVAQQDSLPGRDLTTYLDKNLSVKAYELLKKVVKDKKATGGVVVAQDPQTGGVLALVSYPSFDANKMATGISSQEYQGLAQDPSKPFFNRAISANYPPGSTFKMITASAGLSEGTIDRNTTIFDPGYISVNGYRFNNWKLDGHGPVNIIRALQVSNDTYFYTVGGGYGDVKGVGIEKLSTWAKKFGVGTITGLDASGEVSGYMPDGISRAWYLGDTYISAIGQGDILMTPLQLNLITSYFANGGYLIKPRIVQAVDGVVAFESEIVSQNLISKKNYDIVREGLHASVIPGGTAYPVYDVPAKFGVELGGKTGTSEYIDKDGKPATHAWFTVFGPFDKANIALTVFLEGGGSGSDDAAPIARELLGLWFGKR